MKHLHKSSGLEFECGELMEHSRDIQADGVRKTYDMTVITFWQTPDGESPLIVGYYFGDYDQNTTDEYIDRWLKAFGDCRQIIAAYYYTNEEVLDDAWRDTALNALNAVNDIEHRLLD